MYTQLYLQQFLTTALGADDSKISRTFNFIIPQPHPHLVNKSRYSMHPSLRGPRDGLDAGKKH